MVKKYYEAYDERYKVVHEKNLLWFSQNPTPELLTWIERNNIPKEDEILEVGCGEGRDTLYLASLGYQLVGVDVSLAAIEKCKQFANQRHLKVEWVVGDALFLNQQLNRRFKWMYSVATLHMLVDELDRHRFLKSLFHLLEPKGKLILVNMGDGETERKSDPMNAFEIEERNHSGTGQKMMVTGTSCRIVNWDHYQKELMDAGFIIENMLLTENDEYYQCMSVYLTRI